MEPRQLRDQRRRGRRGYDWQWEGEAWKAEQLVFFARDWLKQYSVEPDTLGCELCSIKVVV